MTTIIPNELLPYLKCKHLHDYGDVLYLAFNDPLAVDCVIRAFVIYGRNQTNNFYVDKEVLQAFKKAYDTLQQAQQRFDQDLKDLLAEDDEGPS